MQTKDTAVSMQRKRILRAGDVYLYSDDNSPSEQRINASEENLNNSIFMICQERLS